MSYIISISFLDDFYSFTTVAILAIAGFIFGFILKQSIIKKFKKRIIELEDDLLKKDSTILALEQKVADLTKNSGKTDILHKVS